MTPYERIFLDKFFQLHGKHLYADEWNSNAIYFLNSVSPKIVGFDFTSDEMNSLMKQGENLNKMAVKNAKGVEKHIIKHLNRVFFTDNRRTAYEYHGKVIAYDFINSECIDENGKSHLCKITLKLSSELVDEPYLELFDPDVSENALGKYKQILVSEAIIKYLIKHGKPYKQDELLLLLEEEFHNVYPKSIKFDYSMVKENMKRMFALWDKIEK